MTTATAKRDQLLAKMQAIIAGATGRGVVYYREEDALKALTAQIKALDRQIGDRASTIPRWRGVHGRSRVNGTAAVQLAQLRRTRDLELKNAAGRRRRTAGIGTFAARAYASQLRGRR